MQIKNLVQGMFDDDDGVSPVIGVILMVAITVILAAVIGTFVLNNNNLSETSPQVNWDYQVTDVSSDSDGNTELVATHEGGESVNPDSLSYATTEADRSLTVASAPSELSAGTQIVLSNDNTASTPVDQGFDSSSGETIRIVWSAEGGGSTATIGQYQIP